MEDTSDDLDIEPSFLLPRDFHQLYDSVFDDEKAKVSSGLRVLKPLFSGTGVSDGINKLDVKFHPDLWSPGKRITVNIPVYKPVLHKGSSGTKESGLKEDEEINNTHNHPQEKSAVTKELKEQINKDIKICPRRLVSKSVRRLMQQRMQRWGPPAADADIGEKGYESLLSNISPNQIVNFIGLNKATLLPPVYPNRSLNPGSYNDESNLFVTRQSGRPPSYSARHELMERGYVTGFPPPYHLK